MEAEIILLCLYIIITAANITTFVMVRKKYYETGNVWIHWQKELYDLEHGRNRFVNAKTEEIARKVYEEKMEAENEI